MVQFNSLKNDDAAEAAGTGVVGAMGAIPGLNFFSPAIAEAIAQGNAAKVRQQQAANAQAIDLPGYMSYGNVDAEYAGDVDPSLYDTPESVEATLANEAPEGRQAMLDALQQLAKVTDQSVGSAQAQRRQQAEMDARQLANSREQGIKQDAMRRGRIGGAADMIARQQAAQAGANRSLDAGLQSAEQAALQELAGVNTRANIGSNLRSGDQALAFNNADIINKIGMYNADARNSAAQRNADIKNTMGLANRGARQDFLNNKTQLGMSKIDRENTNTSKKFGDQMTKYDAVNDVLNAQAGGAAKSGEKARAAGAQGWENTKDVYEMVMGMMGGGLGG